MCSSASRRIPLLMAKLWVVVLPSSSAAPGCARSAPWWNDCRSSPSSAAASSCCSRLNNIAAWYPWDFCFTTVHYQVAWITFGALVIHIGAKFLDHP